MFTIFLCLQELSNISDENHASPVRSQDISRMAVYVLGSLSLHYSAPTSHLSQQEHVNQSSKFMNHRYSQQRALQDIPPQALSVCSSQDSVGVYVFDACAPLGGRRL